MSKQQRKNALQEKQNKLSTYLIVPIALILFIVPLIVHMRMVNISSSAVAFWKGGTIDSDFFSYYKMVWFLIFTGLAIIAFIIKMTKIEFKIKKTWLYIPMGIYSLFVIISSVSSKTRDVAFKGFPNRYEGIYVLLAYMVILFIVINLLDNEKQLKIILGGLGISTSIIGLIGVFQYFNMDFFQTMLGKKIMLPFANWNMVNGLSFKLGARAVYGTLFHTNYVGSFTAMLFPFTLTLFIMLKERNYKICLGALNAIMFLCLITSHSRAGIAGAIISTVIVVLLSLSAKKLKVNIKSLGILVVVLIVIFVGVNNVSKQTVSDKIGTLYNDSSPSVTSVAGIKEVSVTKELISLGDGTDTLNISLKDGKMKLTDQNKNKVPFEYDLKTNKATFKQPQYASYTITIMKYSGQPVIDIVKGSFKVDFVVTPVGYKLFSSNGQILDINKVETFGFKGYENLGSARGYIWSRSLPLLKHTIIKGYGPDTFAIHFPQNDYIGKLLAYGDANIVVDKPHNFYLQTGLNTGIISLIGLLALFVMYLLATFKTLIGREFNNLTEITGAGICAAICGYLVAGLFNDSTLSVSPVFWILLGVGISTNLMLNSRESIKK